jgi:hypothetical protein
MDSSNAEFPPPHELPVEYIPSEARRPAPFTSYFSLEELKAFQETHEAMLKRARQQSLAAGVLPMRAVIHRCYH